VNPTNAATEWTFWSAHGWQGRAIENREEEEPECFPMAKHRGEALPPILPGILGKDV